MNKKLLIAAALTLVLSACSSGSSTAETIHLQNPVRQPEPTRIDADAESWSTTTTATAAQRDTWDRKEVTQVPRDVTFQDYGQNPWVNTSDDALSTFAVDVDTGSYTIMRRWLDEGLLPPAESVRPEEYIAYFDMGYETPRRDVFAVYVDGAHTPYDEQPGDYLLRVGIKGEEVSERGRDPVTLTFVIDVSGSMQQGGRLELVKDALAILVESLGANDTVSIVAYNSSARVVLEPTPADEYRTITRAIDRLEPGGSTNAEAGLTLGYDLAEESFDRGGANRVILLSDGVANVGVTGPGGIFERIARSADSGIDLLTVGVGLGNYNDVLLEQLADMANGVYRYVDTIDEAERVFSEDLTGTLVTIARDMKVQVEFDPEAVKWYRLVGFENRDVADEDFRNDRVDGGEVGAGHTVTALYHLELQPGVRGRDRLGAVSIRWVDPEREETREMSGEIRAEALSGSWRDTDPHFRLAASVSAFAEALRSARHAGDYTLDDVAEEVTYLSRELDDPDVDQLEDLIDRAIRLQRR